VEGGGLLARCRSPAPRRATGQPRSEGSE